MTNSKKTSYFNRVEDKYVFRVSTIFWHLLIGIITVAAILAVVFFIWSIIPPSKEIIVAAPLPTKPAFPPVEKVTLSDLKQGLEKNLPIPFQSPPQQVQLQKVVEYDSDKPAYDVTLSDLKKIVPDNQWEPKRLVIYNQIGWDLYQSEPYGVYYNDGRSVEQNLENIYSTLKIKKYAEKKKALDSFIKVVIAAPMDYKGKTIEIISYSINENWKNSKLLDSLCTAIASGLPLLNENPRLDVHQNLISFSFNNPQSVFTFIPFVRETCKDFPATDKANGVEVIIASYYRYFNNNVEIQKEATQQFIELIPSIRDMALSLALQKFYSIYNKKNQNRNEEIARILNEYNAQVNAIIADSTMKAMQEEGKYLLAKNLKDEIKWKSILGIGGGFVAVALLGTILTLLSIQRILKKMEVVNENNS